MATPPDDPKPSSTATNAAAAAPPGSTLETQAQPKHHSQSDKEPTTAAAIQDAPDPDEDDLDELDDMLEEFSAAPGSSGPGRPDKEPSSTADPIKASTDSAGGGGTAIDDSSDAFAAQLQKEMAALMGEIQESPAMQAQLDAMMKELNTGAPGAQSEETKKAIDEVVKMAEAHEPAGPPAQGTGTGSKGAAATGSDFQDTIKRTMERMQASGESASAAANASATSETDMLESLLREMATAGGEGGEGGEEDFSKMLLGMMEQLTNKEILYEPMKDLHTKFPQWMKENEGKVDEKDWKRYEEQQGLVQEIVGRFEKQGYSDESAEDREYIVERMQKMQAAGSPPPDLVGDMKETQEALGDLDAGCAQQ